MKKILIALCLILISSTVYSGEGLNDEKLDSLYQKAKKAITEGNEKLADFYIARYTGLTIRDEDTDRSIADFNSLFATYKVSKPTSLISGKYSQDFIEWFLLSSYEIWGRDDDNDIDAETQTMGILSDENKEYIVTLIASPYVEGWYIKKDEEQRIAVLTLMDWTSKPYLVLIKHEDGIPLKISEEMKIDTGSHPIQYVWPIEFHDLESDGTPEVWMRYNQTWATGFSQVLDIYKIEDDSKLVLFKRFEGEAEGIARRLDDGTIEIAKSFTNESGVGHLGYDKHHFERFEFKNGEFQKIDERDEDNILWSDAWIEYYFGDIDERQ